MTNEDIAIKVTSVSKSFKLPHEKVSSIKSALINFRKRDKSYEEQRVLQDISFEVKKGEFFGIVGRNGSGKSTLLKLMAGIYAHDNGSIQVNGKLTPFIELGVGFNPELTGRENVFLNGALLGFNRKAMEAMYQDIVSFAELEKFMDQKLKNYSSGMQVRLAFSIAIRGNTDILILDEVLAVGDAAFQQKCNEYFEQLKKEKKTIILVTHDMGAVERYCTKALMLHDGSIKLIGSPSQVAKQYTVDNYQPPDPAKQVSGELSSAVKSLDVIVKSPIELTSQHTLEFSVTYQLTRDLPVHLGLSLMYRDVAIVEHNSRDIDIPGTKGIVHTVDYKLPLHKFNKGELKVDVAIFNYETKQLIGYKLDACKFSMTSNSSTKGGPVISDGVWKIAKNG